MVLEDLNASPPSLQKNEVLNRPGGRSNLQLHAVETDVVVVYSEQLVLKIKASQTPETAKTPAIPKDDRGAFSMQT